MATFLNLSETKKKRYEGTYRVVPKVNWVDLLEKEFGTPDWTELYPVKAGKDDHLTPVGMLSPRMACKLFHDGVFIIQKAEEHAKYFQDRMPEISHRCYKKKQWRKQFFEASRRVCCRLVRGLGFHTNCLAEDAFVHMILADTFILGWRRIEKYTGVAGEPGALPETDKDRDFDRVMRVATNDDIAFLMKGGDPTQAAAKGVAEKKKGKETTSSAAKADVRDVKSWFNMYDKDRTHCFDHIVAIADDEIEGGSDTASTFSAYSSIDFGDENRSRSGSILSEGGGSAPGTPSSPFGRKRIGSPRASTAPHLDSLKEVPSSSDLASAMGALAT